MVVEYRMLLMVLISSLFFFHTLSSPFILTSEFVFWWVCLNLLIIGLSWFNNCLSFYIANIKEFFYFQLSSYDMLQQRKPQPITYWQKRKFIDIVRCLEEGLLKTALTKVPCIMNISSPLLLFHWFWRKHAINGCA